MTHHAGVLKLLNVLFSSETNQETKRRVLSDEFNIPMTRHGKGNGSGNGRRHIKGNRADVTEFDREPDDNDGFDSTASYDGFTDSC